MGLNPSTSSNRTFVSIVNGKFAQRVKEETFNAVKRTITKKDNSTLVVYEKIYNDIDAMLVSVEVDESGSYGDQLKVNMSAGAENITITLALSGREAKSFLCCLKNIDTTKSVTLAPYNFVAKDTGKQVIGMNIYQGEKKDGKHPKENKVTAYFSKETPNGLPQVPDGADKDEFKLTMKSQELFLKKWVKKFVTSDFKGASTVTAKPTSEPATMGAEHESQDLPF
jgi:hypothetical protein